MSDSDSDGVPPAPVKGKRQMTPEQLARLAENRKKALEVRRRNKLKRDAEKLDRLKSAVSGAADVKSEAKLESATIVSEPKTEVEVPAPATVVKPKDKRAEHGDSFSIGAMLGQLSAKVDLLAAQVHRGRGRKVAVSSDEEEPVERPAVKKRVPMPIEVPDEEPRLPPVPPPSFMWKNMGLMR